MSRRYNFITVIKRTMQYVCISTWNIKVHSLMRKLLFVLNTHEIFSIIRNIIKKNLHFKKYWEKVTLRYCVTK